MTNWQDAGSGVMLWAPTTQVEMETADRTFSRLSIGAENTENYGNDDVTAEADSILPSVEENLRTKQTIFQELFGTPKEVPALSRNIQSPISSTIKSSSPISAENTFFTPQGSVSSPATLPRLSNSPTKSILTPSSDSSTIADYDSDRTDFLDTTESPCPVSRVRNSRRDTGVTSHCFKIQKVSSTSTPVRRKLDFGPVSGAIKSSKMGLAALEYSPSHRWTYEEREFLCCMWRFYARNPVDFARIYNHVFSQDLSMTKIRDQLEHFLRYHGTDAFPVYKAVFSIPFHDPDNEFEATRNMIEAAAAELNIELHRLSKEIVLPSGRAKYARSLMIRKTYRSLVKRAKTMHAHNTAKKRHPTRAKHFGGFAKSVDAQLEDIEIVVDKETIDTSPVYKYPQNPSQPSSHMPALAFRVWHEDSGTKFSKEKGFVAGAVGAWNGAMPNFRLDDPEERKMILMTCNSHFGNGKIHSYWISVFTSLLEALVKAASMKHPRIALIDLSHPSLQIKLPAANVLRDLKKIGQTQWARTKHHAEILLFGTIPAASIIQSFSLNELIALNDAHDIVQEMLQLHEFRTGRRTSTVAASLATKNVTLDSYSAKAMALVCKQFGLIELKHIHDLVARLVDGWSIIDDASGDIKDISFVFAMTLNSCAYPLEDVARTFVEGCAQGTKILRFWDERRRSGARRVRSS